MNQSHRVGVWGELMVSAYLVSRDYSVYLPVMDGDKTDMIVKDSKKNLMSVSVKSARINERGGLRFSGGRKSEADYLALVSTDTEEIRFLNCEKCVKDSHKAGNFRMTYRDFSKLPKLPV